MRTQGAEAMTVLLFVGETMNMVRQLRRKKGGSPHIDSGTSHTCGLREDGAISSVGARMILANPYRHSNGIQSKVTGQRNCM